MPPLVLAPEIRNADEQLEDWDGEGGKASCDAFPPAKDPGPAEPDERMVQRCTIRRDDPDEGLDDPAEAARQSLLDAIVLGKAPTFFGAARWAWSSLESLVAAGHDPATLEGLEAAGWLCRWVTERDDEPLSWSNPSPPPSGECLTLTAWGAERLGVEIREDPHREKPHWAPILERRPRSTPCPRWLRFGGGQIEFPEAIVDTAPGPLEEIVMVERYSKDGGRSNLEPLMVLGTFVRIDPRLGGKSKPKAKASKKTRKKAKTAAQVGAMAE